MRVLLPSADPAREYRFEVTEMLYGVDHAGDHIWVCGSTGTVSRSLDGGRTWERSPKIFESALPIGNVTDRCSSLSFLNENEGWAAGYRSLWQTTDGGATWARLPSILDVASLDADTARAQRIDSVTRVTTTTAWARTAEGALFRTRDGGASWAAMPGLSSVPAVLERNDGRPLVLASAAPPDASIEDVIPMSSDAWVAVGKTGIINLNLELFDSRGLIRSGPPTTPPNGKRRRLEGQTTGRTRTWGWSGRDVFKSEDAGRSWARIGKLPGKVERLVAVSDEVVLARAGGVLLRSADQGRTWDATAELATRIDWERATGEPANLQDADSLSCLKNSPGWVAVVFGARTSHGGSSRTLRLEVDASGAVNLGGKGAVPVPLPRATLDHRPPQGRVLTAGGRFGMHDVPDVCEGHVDVRE